MNKTNANETSTIGTQDLFTRLAREHLGIQTLAERKMDDLDFHSVGVVALKRALEAAYQAGMKAAK